MNAQLEADSYELAFLISDELRQQQLNDNKLYSSATADANSDAQTDTDGDADSDAERD